MKVALQQVRQLMPYLPPGTMRYVWTYVIISCLLSLLDIAALMLLALSLSAMLAGNPVTIPLFGTVSQDGYVWLLFLVSSLVLAKSLLTLLQQWAATRKFAAFELVLGLKLFEAYMGAAWVERLGRSSSKLVRMADVGVTAVINGLLVPVIQLPAILVSSVLIIGTLIVVQPVTAAITIVYLGLMAYIMHVVLAKKSLEAGVVNRRYSYRVAEIMTEMVGALKEITLQNKFDEIHEVLRVNRTHASRARSNIRFLAAVPKFIMDTALIGGFLIVGLFAYLIDGSLSSAISSVVMFAVAGMRLVPSLTGFQSLLNGLNSNQSQVNAVLGDLWQSDKYRANIENLGKEKIHGEPKELRLENVTFTYPTGEQPAVSNVSLTIKMGSSVGIVGESGSGKSTLVDILLGLLVPQEGSIYIGDQNLEDVLGDWRSRVGYVPQDVSLFDGTIAQNVALTWNKAPDMPKIEECLKRAQLWDVLQSRPGGMQARVGDRGIALSGGQRQRLGIARALYTDPLILIMDEATSALDTKTESKVAQAVAGLRGQVTIISVAHRLSTVKDADELFYMEDSFVLARGTFDEVVATVPTFREQAQLAGLLGEIEADSQSAL